MDTRTQAQIYLADQRGHSEENTIRSQHTFNVGAYIAEGRQPFGPLYLLNDDELKAGASLTRQVEQDTLVIILPVVGGLEYRSDRAGESSVGIATQGFLEPGQAGVFPLEKDGQYTVSNPYEIEQINCLQIWLKTRKKHMVNGVNLCKFDFSHKNRLLPLTEDHPDYGVFIGQYGGRQEGTYRVRKRVGDTRDRGVFVFVIQGAFEVANRLVHERDGLALGYPKDDAVEFEALSNDAILVLIDLPLD